MITSNSQVVLSPLKAKTSPLVGLACKVGGTSTRFCIESHDASDKELDREIKAGIIELLDKSNSSSKYTHITEEFDEELNTKIYSLEEIKDEKINGTQINTNGENLNHLFTWFGKLTKLLSEKDGKLFIQMSWPGESFGKEGSRNQSFKYPNIKSIDKDFIKLSQTKAAKDGKPRINLRKEIFKRAKVLGAKKISKTLKFQAKNDAVTNIEAGAELLIQKDDYQHDYIEKYGTLAKDEDRVEFDIGDTLVAATLGTGANVATLELKQNRKSGAEYYETVNHEIGRDPHLMTNLDEIKVFRIDQKSEDTNLFEELFARGTKPNLRSPNNGVLGIIKKSLRLFKELEKVSEETKKLSKEEVNKILNGDNYQSKVIISGMRLLKLLGLEFTNLKRSKFLNKLKTNEIDHLTYQDLITAIKAAREEKSSNPILDSIFGLVAKKFGGEIKRAISNRKKKAKGNFKYPRYIIINGGFFDNLLKVPAFKDVFFKSITYRGICPRPIRIEPEHYDGTKVLLDERIAIHKMQAGIK